MPNFLVTQNYTILTHFQKKIVIKAVNEDDAYERHEEKGDSAGEVISDEELYDEFEGYGDLLIEPFLSIEEGLLSINQLKDKENNG